MEVIAKNCKTHPFCPHGPCLMFERKSAKGVKTGRKFFACSACRDRSVCGYFQWVDDDLSVQVKQYWEKINKESAPPFSHEECVKRLITISQLAPSKRRYCRTCSLLLLPEEENHIKHDIIDKITSENLLQPSLLFHTLRNKKAEAQYFFSEKTVHFITSMLNRNHYSKFVLIGVPKIHEYITSLKNPKLTSFLLDIDHRYLQFFSPEEFCHYNLFNNHFFGGKSAQKNFKQYLKENKNGKLIILLDPPFGGLIDAISYSLSEISKWWQISNGKSSTENVPMLWFFPYFLEPRIIKNIPDMVMMDYKVKYLNHEKYGTKSGSKGSPIRIFTNIEKSTFVLPADEGYRFCRLCERYISKENKHCSKCNACTTKHGKTYKHCDDCQKCVKNSYIHCGIHNKCVPKPSDLNQSMKNECKCGVHDSSEENSNKCYKCFGYGHRKRGCPMNTRSKLVQNKRRKIENVHKK